VQLNSISKALIQAIFSTQENQSKKVLEF